MKGYVCHLREKCGAQSTKKRHEMLNFFLAPLKTSNYLLFTKILQKKLQDIRATIDNLSLLEMHSWYNAVFLLSREKWAARGIK